MKKRVLHKTHQVILSNQQILELAYLKKKGTTKGTTKGAGCLLKAN